MDSEYTLVKQKAQSEFDAYRLINNYRQAYLEKVFENKWTGFNTKVKIWALSTLPLIPFAFFCL